MTGAASRPVPRPGNQAVAPATIDDLLIEARSGLARLDPRAAFRAIRDGAVLIDTRPEWQRRADGEIPGALVIERNHLEWRCDPSSPARVPEAADHQVAWIVCCDEGYSSSLAAASLQALGLSNATDVIGGFRAWRAAGLPVARPAKPSRPPLAEPDPRPPERDKQHQPERRAAGPSAITRTPEPADLRAITRANSAVAGCSDSAGHL
jgi:rhodanese-related sulfurtransferase